jgi:hypothetical protein
MTDNTQPRDEILTHLGDVGDLTLDNEALFLLNLSHPDPVQGLDGERRGRPIPRSVSWCWKSKFALHPGLRRSRFRYLASRAAR